MGIGLIGVSLFMLLGFLNAEGAMSWAKGIALLVSVGIPGAAGGVLLNQHFGGGKRLATKREQLKRQTQEAELLRLAGLHDGKLTVVEVMRELAMSHDDADGLLKSTVQRGLAEIEVTDAGLLVYRFPDIQALDSKSSSAGVLDA